MVVKVSKKSAFFRAAVEPNADVPTVVIITLVSCVIVTKSLQLLKQCEGIYVIFPNLIFSRCPAL